MKPTPVKILKYPEFITNGDKFEHKGILVEIDGDLFVQQGPVTIGTVGYTNTIRASHCLYEEISE